MGVDIPNDKPIGISLRYLFGIGPVKALEICRGTNINPATRARELKEDEVARVTAFIDEHVPLVEGALRREIQQNIQRLRKINSYRGTRHVKGLPVRGQRTKTNARTRKGKKKTVAVKRSVKDIR
jgi:small subunit ribosomal protein S13